jgi:hypothetical protein
MGEEYIIYGREHFTGPMIEFKLIALLVFTPTYG